MGNKRKRSKPAVKYQGFALEIPLIDEIKKHIKDKPEYRSVTDFVRDAIKFRLHTPIESQKLYLNLDDPKGGYVTLQKINKRLDELEKNQKNK
jgi:Arc/MetJ-type ribon-helix-helix transcriptional regulator